MINIAPVDLAQAAIGPGMAVYSRHSRILDAQGSPLTVSDALAIINEVLDRYLSEQDEELDRGSRFCVALFSQLAFNEMNFGEADVLARAKNTSVDSLVKRAVVLAKKGVVRLLDRKEIPAKITPKEDNVWLLTQQLTRALETGGITACAEIVLKVDSNYQVDLARSLAYRLYSLCERKNWATEALAYNSLVQAWPEIQSRILDIQRSGQVNSDGSLF